MVAGCSSALIDARVVSLCAKLESIILLHQMFPFVILFLRKKHAARHAGDSRLSSLRPHHRSLSRQLSAPKSQRRERWPGLLYPAKYPTRDTGPGGRSPVAESFASVEMNRQSSAVLPPSSSQTSSVSLRRRREKSR